MSLGMREITSPAEQCGKCSVWVPVFEFLWEKIWWCLCYTACNGQEGFDLESKGLKVSLVLLRVFGRNSLPDQNPGGSLALSICACHGQPIVAAVSKHDVCPASAGRSETRSPSGSAPLCVAVPRSCGCLCLVLATHKPAGGPEKLTSWRKKIFGLG